ncbi:MAG TPA: kelch repeat-containing protein [Candidatus Saccharimonadia bacterium]|nr:kelch repeat-containing protein [Candidatus Saccharimonadia bacterium]
MPGIVAAAEWEPIAPLPVPNGGFAAGAVQGQIIIAGGTTWKEDVKVWLDDVWVYDAGDNQWKPLGKLPNPLAYGVAAEVGDGLLIAGGFDGARGRTEVVKIDADKKISTTPHRLLEATSLGVGGVLGTGAQENLIVFGGSPDPGKLDAVITLGQRVLLGEGKTAHVPGDRMPHFFISAAATCGDGLYVFTSARATSTTTVENLSDAWVFRDGENAWAPIRPYPMAWRGVTALRLDDTHIYLAGGYGGDPESFRSAAFVYDTKKNMYGLGKSLPIAAMVGLVSDGMFVYCLGGEDAKKHRTDKCWRIPVAELLKQ